MFESSYRLEMTRNGKSYYNQPILFTLSTCLQLITPVCEMVYMKAENELLQDDLVSCSLRDPEGRLFPIFSGKVFKEVPLPSGRIGLILETDLSGIEVNVSFVEEEAENILHEILNQAGITDFNTDLPAITIKRFALQGTAKQAIFSILDFMNRYGSFNAFFDQEGIFNFLPDESLPQGKIEYETGKTILKLGYGELSSFALPVLAGEQVSINGTFQKIIRSVINLSSAKSRTTCYWSES